MQEVLHDFCNVKSDVHTTVETCKYIFFSLATIKAYKKKKIFPSQLLRRVDHEQGQLASCYQGTHKIWSVNERIVTEDAVQSPQRWHDEGWQDEQKWQRFDALCPHNVEQAWQGGREEQERCNAAHEAQEREYNVFVHEKKCDLVVDAKQYTKQDDDLPIQGAFHFGVRIEVD